MWQLMKRIVMKHNQILFLRLFKTFIQNFTQHHFGDRSNQIFARATENTISTFDVGVEIIRPLKILL